MKFRARRRERRRNSSLRIRSARAAPADAVMRLPAICEAFIQRFGPAKKPYDVQGEIERLRAARPCGPRGAVRLPSLARLEQCCTETIGDAIDGVLRDPASAMPYMFAKLADTTIVSDQKIKTQATVRAEEERATQGRTARRPTNGSALNRHFAAEIAAKVDVEIPDGPFAAVARDMMRNTLALNAWRRATPGERSYAAGRAALDDLSPMRSYAEASTPVRGSPSQRADTSVHAGRRRAHGKKMTESGVGDHAVAPPRLVKLVRLPLGSFSLVRRRVERQGADDHPRLKAITGFPVAVFFSLQ